jgi:acyl phosphate:glycerol-3-phosphate acyltransferase
MMAYGWLSAPFVVVAGYLVGAIPFALLLGRGMGGVDVRHAGSGNPGAANVLRTVGPFTALLVAALDIAKGAVVVVLARHVSGIEGVAALTGMAAVIGHVYPVWLGFRGGKGVATACGACFVLDPVVLGVVILIWLVALGLTRYVSVASIAAGVSLPILAIALRSHVSIVAAGLGVMGVIILRHRENIARLRAGTERRLGQH